MIYLLFLLLICYATSAVTAGLCRDVAGNVSTFHVRMRLCLVRSIFAGLACMDMLC